MRQVPECGNSEYSLRALVHLNTDTEPASVFVFHSEVRHTESIGVQDKIKVEYRSARANTDRVSESVM